MELIIIYISFVTIICMVLIVGMYFANSMVNRNLHRRRLDKRMQVIRQLFDEHIAQPNPADLSQSEIDKMRKLALSRIGLEAFTRYYSEYTSQNGFDKAQLYAARIVDYKILMKNYIVRNKYRASYILYLFAEYRLHSPETDRMAIEGLSDKSFYTRNNALNVIKNTGSVPLAINALKVVSAGERYYNGKMIIDFFDTFTGDRDDLSMELLKNFDFSAYLSNG